jgi:nicotinamide-nucleotide amidase
LVTEPGASDVVKGAVVAYQLEVKRDVLGLPAHVLDTAGPVSAEVAVAMADGVRRVLNADVGVATTGVAGPEWHGDKPPGRVVIAVTGDDFHEVREYDFDGDREAVSEQARDGALDLLLFALQEPGGSARSGGEQD